MRRRAVDILQDLLTERAIELERFSRGLAARLLLVLSEAELEFVAMFREELDRLGDLRSRTQLRRLEAMINRLLSRRAQAWRVVERGARAELVELAIAERDFQIRATIAATAIAGLALNAPHVTELRDQVLNRPFHGRVLEDWHRSLLVSDANRVAQTIRLGVVEGLGVDEMVRQVRGSRSLQFRDGLTEVARRNTNSVARTAVTHTAMMAREALWRSNSTLFRGMKWTAVLDSRTTLTCLSRDGKVAPIGDSSVPRGVPRLKPPEARPPAHVNCRSFMVPVLIPTGFVDQPKSVTVLNSDGSTREIVFSSRAERTRWASSHVGDVASETSTESFLRRMSMQKLSDWIGPARAKLLKEGKLPLDRFVDRSGRVYTLDELRRSENEAFSRIEGLLTG